ncbi:hypothetical protein [Streptomyces sp. NPDC023588]
MPLSALRHLDVAREALAAHIVGRLSALGVEVEHRSEGHTRDG